MKQGILDRIKVMNKYVTNKLLIHISGKNFGHFVVLLHIGRKSGKLYRIPVIAEPVENGFVIALTYGRNVDWYKNVAAKGGCSIIWKNKEYCLVNPEFIDPKVGVLAFPAVFRSVLGRVGIPDYLRLEIQP